MELTSCQKILRTIDSRGTLMKARRSRRGVAGHSSWERVPDQGSVKVTLADMATAGCTSL